MGLLDRFAQRIREAIVAAIAQSSDGGLLVHVALERAEGAR